MQSLSGRLLIFSAAFVAATMAATALVLWLIVGHVVREQVDQQLDVQIEALKGSLRFDAAGTPRLSASFDNPPFDRPGWFWQIDTPDGRLNAPPPTHGPGRRPGHDRPGGPPDAPPPEGPTPDLTAAERPGPALHLRQQSATIDGRVVTFTASAPEAALATPARDALFWLLPLILALGLFLLIGTLLQIRFGLRPLADLHGDLQDIERGARDRLSDMPVRELAPVTTEINRLLDQNEARLTETRLHFANLAHGLKTPLASLRLALDRETDPQGRLAELAERMEQRIRRHLSLARKTAGGALTSATPLSPVIADLLAVLRRLYEERALSVTTAGVETLSLRCDEKDAEEILGNLLDNSFKWARSQIAISARRDGRNAILLIEDDGPGILPERRAEVLRAGARLDESMPGDGFGLSIAEELVTLYGGRLELGEGALGGLCVRLTLPALEQAS
ncbi:hypothetical protein BJF93_19155 [Xaviernesmea oryzae]|uniref:histidine kinase n=2 Tax=Xaviernesmea oryzae TaxID=464029 RepID=A0A1Q9B1M7_9HYPH|nr:hypothetical protein BJF93_19155 [Xaviernesmea oryzae]